MAKAPKFLGTGWHFPPQFSENGKEVETVSGVDDIHQSIQIILSTRINERVMREDFGCELADYLYEEIDQGLMSNIENAVTTALIRHEPRIRVEVVDVRENSEKVDMLNIAIRYLVRTTNSRFNMVYPFYINEAYN